MTLLHGLGVPELFSPELTAEWEFKLAQMEHGKLARDDVHARDRRDDEAHRRPGEGARERHDPRRFRHARRARCPKCGGEIHENYKKFQCQSCDFGFWKIMAGRQLELAEADDAAARAHASVRSKAFAAGSAGRSRGIDQLTDANEVTFDFGDGATTTTTQAPDFTRPGAARRRARSAARACSRRRRRMSARRRSGPDKTCDFRSGRVILQRPVERAQMQKLLATGKTDLLQFVSARTRRGFSAFLVRQPDGKIGFEFEARDPAKAGARAARVARRGAARAGPASEGQKPVELHAGRYGPYVKHGDRQRHGSRPRPGRRADARRGRRADRGEGRARGE